MRRMAAVELPHSDLARREQRPSRRSRDHLHFDASKASCGASPARTRSRPIHHVKQTTEWHPAPSVCRTSKVFGAREAAVDRT